MGISYRGEKHYSVKFATLFNIQLNISIQVRYLPILDQYMTLDGIFS